MKHFVPLLFLTLVVGLSARDEPNRVGYRMPSMDHLRFEGDAPEMEGKFLLIDFWATWCPPCVDSIPKLNTWHRASEEYGFVVIGITDERQSKVDRLRKKQPIDYTVAYDRRGTLKRQLGIRSIPRLLLLGPNRQILWEGHPASFSLPLLIQKTKHWRMLHETTGFRDVIVEHFDQSMKSNVGADMVYAILIARVGEPRRSYGPFDVGELSVAEAETQLMEAIMKDIPAEGIQALALVSVIGDDPEAEGFSAREGSVAVWIATGHQAERFAFTWDGDVQSTVELVADPKPADSEAECFQPLLAALATEPAEATN